ncbi:MAG: BREX system ATP-binding domain-containing protein [Methanosarcinales archaeon]
MQVKPTASQLRELGIMRKIENIDIAKEYLAAILCFMKNLGYKALLLSIDEFEYLFSLVSKSQYSIYLALLRGLYDFPIGLDITPDKLANMALFIGISEDGWNKLKEIEKKEISEGGPTRALARRVDLETTLLNFDRKNTEELIEKVLRYNRITEKFEEDPLIPFTKDFVGYIYKITEGLPSAIKVRCAHVLDAGLADRVPLLTEEYAQKVLEERGF